MRYFRRLPPLLRVASLLGLLFYLAALALPMDAFIKFLSSFPHAYQDSSPMFIIALNLLWLGSACSFTVNGYSTRFRRSDRGPFPLDSWQSQVRAIALLSALPLCGIALALIIPRPLSPSWSSSRSPCSRRSWCSWPKSLVWQAADWYAPHRPGDLDKPLAFCSADWPSQELSGLTTKYNQITFCACEPITERMRHGS